MAAIEQVADLMAQRFWDDPGIQAQMRGVKDARKLFYLQCLGQLRAYQEAGLLSQYKDGPSFWVGYRTDEFDAEAFALLAQKYSGDFVEACSQEDVQALQEAIMPVLAISDLAWYTRYFDGPVFDLQIIALEEKLKGRGAFRDIIDSLLSRCAQNDIPLVLQTHNPNNVPLYEHFGFKVLEAPHDSAINLTCYCMAQNGSSLHGAPADV